MSVWQWIQQNTYFLTGTLFVFYVILARRYPTIVGWQAFLDSFESKGGQLMLLWVTDLIVITLLVHYWKGFDAQLQTTIVGLLSGVNGAFLGATGSRTASNGGNGSGGTPPKLDVTFVPGSQPTEKKP